MSALLHVLHFQAVSVRRDFFFDNLYDMWILRLVDKGTGNGSVQGSRAEQVVDCSTANKKDKARRYKHVQTASLRMAEFRYSLVPLRNPKQSETIQQQLTFLARWNLHSFGPARHMLLFELRQDHLISFKKPPCHESCQITENEALIESSFRPNRCQRVPELARNRSGTKLKN